MVFPFTVELKALLGHEKPGSMAGKYPTSRFGNLHTVDGKNRVFVT
jgi:hypothetical protein